MCTKCGASPISNFKWALCQSCYTYNYNHGLLIIPVNYEIIIPDVLVKERRIGNRVAKLWSARKAMELLGLTWTSEWNRSRISKHNLVVDVDYIIEKQPVTRGRMKVDYWYTTPVMRTILNAYKEKGKAILAQGRQPISAQIVRTPLDDVLETLAQFAQNYGNNSEKFWEIVAEAGELLTGRDCYTHLSLKKVLSDVTEKISIWKRIANLVSAMSNGFIRR